MLAKDLKKILVAASDVIVVNVECRYDNETMPSVVTSPNHWVVSISNTWTYLMRSLMAGTVMLNVCAPSQSCKSAMFVSFNCHVHAERPTDAGHHMSLSASDANHDLRGVAQAASRRSQHPQVLDVFSKESYDAHEKRAAERQLVSTCGPYSDRR